MSLFNFIDTIFFNLRSILIPREDSMGCVVPLNLMDVVWSGEKFNL